MLHPLGQKLRELHSCESVGCKCSFLWHLPFLQFCRAIMEVLSVKMSADLCVDVQASVGKELFAYCGYGCGLPILGSSG